MKKINSMFAVAALSIGRAFAEDPAITVPTVPDTFVSSVSVGLLAVGGILVLLYSQRKAIRVFLSMLSR